jgi:addiction module RelE/StbE family toxin
MKVVFSGVAEQDLNEILLYISNDLQNPTAGKNIATKILRRLQSLANFPEMGASLEGINSQLGGYRYLVVDNYLVIYKITERVSVMRILYARSDYIQLLQG